MTTKAGPRDLADPSSFSTECSLVGEVSSYVTQGGAEASHPQPIPNPSGSEPELPC